MEIHRESRSIHGKDFTLHVERIHPVPNLNSKPVLLIHGSIENGKIFYSKSNKGLAPFLAKHGYDVFVPDLRGKGKSKPKINKNSHFSQQDAIDEDLLLLVQAIKDLKGPVPQIWMGHSWGGVLLLSHYAKYAQNTEVSSMVFFATKRRITVQSIKKWWTIDICWRMIGHLTTYFVGYLPAVKLRFGSDNEAKHFFIQTDRWVRRKAWVDEVGFNYQKTLLNTKLPPIFSITGINDDVLGHPKDAQLLLSEIRATSSVFKVLSKKNGQRDDYDHISILTSKHAEHDHFLDVLQFIK